MMKLIRAGVLLLLGQSLAGCTTIHFLQQAGVGQMRIAMRAQSIEVVKAAPGTNPRVGSLLDEVPRIKQFAVEHGLKATTNYESYVHVDGPAVVWVVNACRPLEFSPKTWKFPVVGGFSYLGWFQAKHAHAHADRLQRRGWDVYVRGAAAYSTLGWFRDPIFSTMLSETDDALASLVEAVLHESVHSTVHVKNQSRFNESLAQFAAEHLAMAYLEETAGAAAAATISYRARLEQEQVVNDQMDHAYRALQGVYASGTRMTEKLEQKRAILASLQEGLGLNWDLNNAVLMNYVTYASGTGDFLSLLGATGQNWPEFFARLAGISPEDYDSPQQEGFAGVLLPLLDASPPQRGRFETGTTG